MLTRLIIKNFKQFTDIEIELGETVVFIGPNNSGKTSALQALALWDIGLKRWQEKRSGRESPEKRPGVTLNRRDLLTIPVPDANLLWRDLHVRNVRKQNGKQLTSNIRIDILVEGVTDGTAWTCGLEFDYANEESFYCRPLRTSDDKNPHRMPVPPTSDVRIAFLPPMSGLASNEVRLDPGAINVRIGEGRTAEVLRNLCYQISSLEDGVQRWKEVCQQIKSLFGIELDPPQYVAERGEITMTYRTRSGIRLDLSTSGRGLQQTLLVLAHLALNPRSVLLLDEPDAHLEILRQRQIYQLLTDTARKQGSQIIVASHSEIILNEAADRDIVVAFLGKPHRIDDRGQQVSKSLKDIGFDQYYQAEQTGWALYLEGATDLAILLAFAEVLEHPVAEKLRRPFVKYVENQPTKARAHFFGMCEAKKDLVGFALFDRLGSSERLQDHPNLRERMWKRREIENYLCQKQVLFSWVRSQARERSAGPLFPNHHWEATMEQSIAQLEQALEILGRGSPWSPDIKATDDFLDRLFDNFFSKLNLPNLMRKTDYHQLAGFVRAEDLDPEVSEVLDAILAISQRAAPVGGNDA